MANSAKDTKMRYMENYYRYKKNCVKKTPVFPVAANDLYIQLRKLYAK